MSEERGGYLPPNPYHAFSLRVVIDYGCSALFAAKGDPSLLSAPADAALPKEGVGTDSPDDGPEPGMIIQYETADELIGAILKWLVKEDGDE